MKRNQSKSFLNFSKNPSSPDPTGVFIVRRPSRHIDLLRPIDQGGDLHLRAQHRLRVGQQEPGVQIRSLPLKLLARLHVDQQEKVAL